MSPSLTAMMDEGRADLALFLGRAFTLTKRREGKEEDGRKRVTRRLKREKTAKRRQGEQMWHRRYLSFHFNSGREGQ